MLKILDPTAAPVTGKLMLAPRFSTLDGLRIGILWNGRTYGAKVMTKVLEILSEKYTFSTTDILKKPYLGNIAPEEYFEKLAADKVDAVLVGVGD